MARLRSDILIAALLRRAQQAGAFAVLRRRGAGEAGAIFITVDHLDGTIDLYAPAPPRPDDEPDRARRFDIVMRGVSAEEIQNRMLREEKFDTDLWWIEIEDRAGRSFTDEG